MPGLPAGHAADRRWPGASATHLRRQS